MGDYAFTPWRRYGHDRVYIERGGVRIGHLDRRAGTLAVTGAGEDEVRAALAAAGLLDAASEPTADRAAASPAASPAAGAAPSAAASPAADPAPPNAPPPAPPPAPPAIEWAVTLPGDTATYRAGASARAQARAERDAAPVRTALARLLRVHTDERAWRVGADGEEAVARRLAPLERDGWTVVHDLPIGASANVDHLVAGPGGVFSLNTKNLTGRVWVAGDAFRHNGQRADYVRKARWEAAAVAKTLARAAGVPVDVHGLVVVLCDDLTVKEQPRDVTVVSAARVRRWLAARRPVLDQPARERVARAARDPRTWPRSVER